MVSIKKTKVFVLAAGLGTRLWPLTVTIPKPLIEINPGVPVIDMVLDQLDNNGVLPENICINYHHLPLKMAYALSKLPCRLSPEVYLAGTAGALKLQEEWLSEIFIVVNGDTITDVSLKRMLKEHVQQEAVATVFTHDDEYHTGGTYIFNKEVLALIPQGEPFSINGQLIPKLNELGKKIHLCKWLNASYWDIGTFEGLHKAKMFFKDGTNGIYH